MSKAKKKVQKLTDEQYNAYISTLKESDRLNETDKNMRQNENN